MLKNTAQYAQDLINRESVQQKTKYGRPILEYNFFSHPQNSKLKGVKGNQGSINDVMMHIRAAGPGQKTHRAKRLSEKCNKLSV